MSFSTESRDRRCRVLLGTSAGVLAKRIRGSKSSTGERGFRSPWIARNILGSVTSVYQAAWTSDKWQASTNSSVSHLFGSPSVKLRRRIAPVRGSATRSVIRASRRVFSTAWGLRRAVWVRRIAVEYAFSVRPFIRSTSSGVGSFEPLFQGVRTARGFAMSICSHNRRARGSQQ